MINNDPITAPTRVQQVVKVLVVREDDVAAHVKQETLGGDVCAGQAARLLGLQGSRPKNKGQVTKRAGAKKERSGTSVQAKPPASSDCSH